MEKIGQKKLALIHIVKKELRLSDKEYRKILKDSAGVRSAKDLDRKGFQKLMAYFVRSRHWQPGPGGLTVRQKIFIKTLGRNLDWDDDHLGNFIRKYYHKEGVDKLSKKEAMKLIESLKNIQKHKG